MHSAVLEVLRMGIWHKLISQPIRCFYYLASYLSPAHRVWAASPPAGSVHKPIACEMYPLDIILNVQNTFHPSNIFSDSAVDHTRSFSTSVSDRARRFPERSKPIAGDKKKYSERAPVTSIKDVSTKGSSKCFRSRLRPQKRCISRRSPKKRPLTKDLPAPDHHSFSEIRPQLKTSLHCEQQPIELSQVSQRIRSLWLF